MPIEIDISAEKLALCAAETIRICRVCHTALVVGFGNRACTVRCGGNNMRVSVLSMICMATTAIVSMGLPVVLFVAFHKKYNLRIPLMLLGIAGFVLFALVLEGSAHSIVFGKFALREKPLVYILYGIFMAGVFEETARFVAFKILKRKYDGIGTGLAYGIGHGGIEAILLSGLPMVSSIVFGIFLNTGNAEMLTGELQGAALEQIGARITALTTTAPYLFLVNGLERVLAICIQLSLSVIVFYSVHGKNSLWLYPFSILLHAIIDLPAAAMQVGVIKNMFLAELLLFIGAILSGTLARCVVSRRAPLSRPPFCRRLPKK